MTARLAHFEVEAQSWAARVLMPLTDNRLATRTLVADRAGNALSLLQNGPSSGR